MATNSLVVNDRPAVPDGETADKRLATLGATVRAALAAIAHPTNEMLTHAIAIGAALHEAKALLPYGRREKGLMQWLQRECSGLSLRSGRDYLKLFAHRDRIEEVRQHAAELQTLSVRGALRLIKTGNPRAGRKPASRLKLAHWKAATPAQRTAFISGIPLAEWLAVMPADWRGQIIARVDGLRATAAKPVTAGMKKAA